MAKWLIRASLSRWVISLFNLGIAAMVLVAIATMVPMLNDLSNNLEDIGVIIDGIGTVLIGHGIVVGERSTLLKTFGRSGTADALERFLDEQCHLYGVGYLVLGILLEVTTTANRLPVYLVHTDGWTMAMVALSALMLTLAVVLLVRQVIMMCVGGARLAHALIGKTMQ